MYNLIRSLKQITDKMKLLMLTFNGRENYLFFEVQYNLIILLNKRAIHNKYKNIKEKNKITAYNYNTLLII